MSVAYVKATKPGQTAGFFFFLFLHIQSCRAAFESAF